MAKDSTINHARFSLAWPTLSLGLGIVAIAAVGTLVVVVSIDNVDILASVALALAILAFASQIIVSLSQSQAANQQLAASERVNAETKGLLAQISTQAAALLTNQSGQFDRVLEAALGPDAIRRAVQSVSPEDEEDPDGGGQPIDTTALAEAIRSSARASVGANPYQWFIDEATGWPTEEESGEAISVVKSLNPWESALFMRRAVGDLAKARRHLAPLGYTDRDGAFGAHTQGLVDKGLIEYEEGQFPDGRPARIRTLTPLGRLAARILNASEEFTPAPDWIRDARG